MNRHNLKNRNKERGAAALEFVLVVPMLLLLLFGIIEFSLLVYNKHILTNASREGARFGIVVTEGTRHNQNEIRALVRGWAGDRLITFGSDTLEDDDITVCSFEADTSGPWACPNATDSNFKDRLRVDVQYNYEFLFVPAFVAGIADTLTIKAETVMNYE